jgi:hypothetical protein
MTTQRGTGPEASRPGANTNLPTFADIWTVRERHYKQAAGWLGQAEQLYVVAPQDAVVAAKLAELHIMIGDRFKDWPQ